MLFQCLLQVVHVIHVGHFYSKIVDNKAENNAMPDVAPETWSVLALVIAFGGEVFFEELVGKDAGLGQAVNPFLDFNIDPSFFLDHVAEVVFYGDLFRDDAKAEAQVLWLGHRSIEVKIS